MSKQNAAVAQMPSIVVNVDDIVSSLAHRNHTSVCGELFAEVVRRRALRDELTAILERWRPEERVAVMVDIIVDIEASRPRSHASPVATGQPQRMYLGKSMAIIEELKSKPTVSVHELAKAIYGNSETRSRNKARALLSKLKSDGLARCVGDGQWEAV